MARFAVRASRAMETRVTNRKDRPEAQDAGKTEARAGSARLALKKETRVPEGATRAVDLCGLVVFSLRPYHFPPPNCKSLRCAKGSADETQT